MKRLLPPALITSVLFAKSYLMSPIALPTNHIVDLDTERYSRTELAQLLQEGKVFTFLAKSKHLEEGDLLTARRELMAKFHIEDFSTTTSGGGFRVAMIVPSALIGPYAQSTSDSVLTYLGRRADTFTLKVFDIPDQNASTIQNALALTEGFDMLIAPLTEKGARNLCEASPAIPTYIPTLRSEQIDCGASDVTFGGIDYREQIKTLNRLNSQKRPVITVGDGSSLSMRLNTLVTETNEIRDSITLPKRSYYRNLIRRHDDLNQSILYLNTPVLKSSLFLSQMTLEEMEPDLILSTQLNYTPQLLTLTQFRDREHMVVADSIAEMEETMEETQTMMGEDVRFNWVNYATIVGLDRRFAQQNGTKRATFEEIQGLDVRYEVRLYDAGLYRFIPHPLPAPFQEPEGEEEIPSLDQNVTEAHEMPDDRFDEPSVYDAP